MGKGWERGGRWGLLTAGPQIGWESLGLAGEPSREPGGEGSGGCSPEPDLREVEGRAGTLNGHWASLEPSLENKVLESKGSDIDGERKLAHTLPALPWAREILGCGDRLGWCW